MSKIISIHGCSPEKIKLYQRQNELNSKIHLVMSEYGLSINFIRHSDLSDGPACFDEVIRKK